MKTIILILFSLISIQAQSWFIPIMTDDGYKNAETKIYLAGQTVSGEQATRIDQFITKVKDSLQITSLSSKFDVMYLLANESAALGLRNLVKRSHDATAVNSPTFTQWQGFTGNGTSSYINTNYIPSTQGIKYTLNSVGSGVYSRTNQSDANKVSYGSRNGSFGYFFQNKFFRGYTINSNSADAVVGDISPTTGLNIMVRDRADTIRVYYNGVLKGIAAQASVNIPNSKVYIGACNNGFDTPIAFTTRQHSFFFVSASLTATEARKLTNCVEWYMDSIGSGVIP